MTDRVYVLDLLDRLGQAADRAVVVHEDAATSGAELLAMIRRTARALQRMGIGPGGLVAMYAPNRPDALAVRYATHLLGAASVYLSAPPDTDRRAAMLRDFAAQLVVVWPETANLLPSTTAPVAWMGPGDSAGVRLDQLAAAEDDAAIDCRARPEDLAVIISSGGTTGTPKGSTRDFATWSRVVSKPSPADRRQLANGKLAYLTQVLVDCTLLGGGTVVLQDGFDAAATLAAIEVERITDLFLVEPQLFELMDHPGLTGYDLSSLRALGHVGAAAAAVLRRRAQQRLGPVIAHSYGASELGMVSALSPAAHDPAVPERFNSAGSVLPNVEIRFRTAGGGLHATEGRIEVRSPDMASGYRHRPVEQAANFADGWYRPQDLAHLDDEGSLCIDGRAADCAEVDGRLVTPAGLQDCLCSVPDIRYAAIVADPDAGSWISAVVEWPGQEITTAACRAAVRARYGDRVADAVHVVPVDRVPLTEQGKPDRQAIRALAAQALATR